MRNLFHKEFNEPNQYHDKLSTKKRVPTEAEFQEEFLKFDGADETDLEIEPYSYKKIGDQRQMF